MPPAKRPVACLLGATASGKSEVGLHAARIERGEVISCDAYAVYRDMPILSAAPTASSDVPHHLVGMVGTDETYDAARFLTDCDAKVEGIRACGGLPWIVGGTALYLRCWLKGLGPEVGRDPTFRARVGALHRRHGSGWLHRLLARLDPERAAEIHPNDLRRIGRALEIIRATGRPASRQRLEWTGPDRVAAVLIGIRRPWADLDDRIARRVEEMFEAGVVEEARDLLRRPLSPQAALVLGLNTLQRHLRGDIDEAAAREEIVRRTRRFARKQMTFFRSFPNLHWIDAAPGELSLDLARRVARVYETASVGGGSPLSSS